MMYDSELVIMSTGAISSTGISQTVLLFLQQIERNEAGVQPINAPFADLANTVKPQYIRQLIFSQLFPMSSFYSRILDGHVISFLN